MKQKLPTFGRRFDSDRIAAVIGVTETEINQAWPCETVSTGLETVIVPLRNLNALRGVCIQPAPYQELISEMGDIAILVYCDEGYDEHHDISVRVFVDCVGVPEDPATGSANGCLAGYLVGNRVFGSNRIEVTVAQGFEINRPSTLYLKAYEVDNGIGIEVGGKVQIIAEGHFRPGIVAAGNR